LLLITKKEILIVIKDRRNLFKSDKNSDWKLSEPKANIPTQLTHKQIYIAVMQVLRDDVITIYAQYHMSRSLTTNVVLDLYMIGTEQAFLPSKSVKFVIVESEIGINRQIFYANSV